MKKPVTRFLRRHKRKVSRTRRTVLVHSRDYAWAARQANPFSVTIDRTTKMQLFRGAYFLGLFLGTLAIIFYHPFFYIHDIRILGTKRLSEAEVKQAINVYWQQKSFGLISRQNYFFLNEENLRGILDNKFSLASATVRKDFPGGLMINVVEKISSLIYDNGGNLAYIGTDGRVIQILGSAPIPTSSSTTAEAIYVPPISFINKTFGDFPIVYDSRQKKIAVGEAVLYPETVRGIAAWINLLEKETGIPVHYIMMEKEIGDATLVTGQGWSLRFRYSEDQLARQMNALRSFLKEKVQRPNLGYIDLRFPGKIYWR